MSNKLTIGQVQISFYNYPEQAGLIETSLENLTDFTFLQPYFKDLDFQIYFQKGGLKIRDIYIVPNETVQKNFLEAQIRRIILLHKYNIEKIIDILGLTYNPIENYNMTEQEQIDNTNTDSGNDTLTIAKNTSLTMERGTQGSSTTDNLGAQSGTTNNENQVAPYNASYTADNKSSGSYSNNSYTNTSTITNDGYTDKDTYGGNDTHTTEYGKKEEGNTTRNMTRTGNIGIMTTQDMILKELAIAKQNLINDICNYITNDLCTGVYSIL